jgi:hypothetical protein
MRKALRRVKYFSNSDECMIECSSLGRERDMSEAC